MYYSKIKFGCSQAAVLPTNFKISEGDSKSRFQKVMHSLADFFEEEEISTYKELLSEDLQDLETLRKEIQNGIIEKVADSVWKEECSEMQNYLKLLEQAQSSFQQFCSIEDKVRKRCVKDWNRYLTDVDELEIGKEYSDGAFLAQAVGCNTNVARITKGPAVSTSLVTSEIQYLYKKRKIGVLYRLTESNLLTLNVSDLYSDLKVLEAEADIVDSLFH